jgi:hypothetical protein
MTKIIETHGSLFRLSDAAYRQLLTLVIAGKEYDLAALGRFIGCIHARMDSFHRDDAEFDLARMDAKRRPGHRSLLAVKPQTAVAGQALRGAAKGSSDTKPTNSSGR